MKVRVAKSVLNGFRRRALRKYPNEHMESIFGVVRKGAFHILAFFPIEHEGKPDKCLYEVDDVEAQREREDCPKKIGQRLGSIHSHPDDDTIPSEADWITSREDGEQVMGIYSIMSGKKRKRTKVSFFAEPIQELEIV